MKAASKIALAAGCALFFIAMLRPDPSPQPLNPNDVVVALSVLDVDGDPLNTSIDFLLRFDGGDGEYFASEVAPVSSGLFTVTFTLSDHDRTLAGEMAGDCVVLPGGASWFGDDGDMFFTDPVEGRAGFAHDLVFADNGDCAATIFLSDPPQFALITVSGNYAPLSRLNVDPLSADGSVSLGGEADVYHISLDLLAANQAIYSWSKVTGALVQVVEPDHNIVAAAIVRRNASATLATSAVFETEIQVDAGVHPSATSVVAFDASTHVASTPAQISSPVAAIVRWRESLGRMGAEGGSVLDFETFHEDIVFELWGTSTAPMQQPVFELLDVKPRPPGSAPQIVLFN